MGWLIPKPDLLPGEEILWTKPAQISLRTGVGGNIYYTNQRLIFVPNGLNIFKHNRPPRSWSLAEIASVGIKERTYTPYDGGFQRRMDVVMKNGDEALFIFQSKTREEGIRELQRIAGLAA